MKKFLFILLSLLVVLLVIAGTWSTILAMLTLFEIATIGENKNIGNTLGILCLGLISIFLAYFLNKRVESSLKYKVKQNYIKEEMHGDMFSESVRSEITKKHSSS